MENVQPQSEVAPAAGEVRWCRTCRNRRPVDAFYETCSECKECKRRRSKRNRALQARKLAAFERFVDVLVDLADRTGEPPQAKAAEGAA